MSIYSVFENFKTTTLIPLYAEKIMDLLHSIHETLSKYDPDVMLSMIQEPIYVILTKIAEPELKSAIYIHYPNSAQEMSRDIVAILNLKRKHLTPKDSVPTLEITIQPSEK